MRGSLCDAEDYINQKLAPAETIPLFGMIPSALKAVIALAKIIIGVAIIVFGMPFFLLSHLTCDTVECLRTINDIMIDTSHALAQRGAQDLIERLHNVVTLGLYYYLNPRSA